MWKKKEEKEEKKEESLLRDLCGDDVKLCDFLSRYLYLNPLVCTSKDCLDILIEEGGKSGNFRPAVDKAIFEGAQNPGEGERYIKVIQNLALKTIKATEQEKAKAEKEELTALAASLVRRIEDQKFMSEKAEDIINVASKFYNERAIVLGESERIQERREKRREAEKQDKIDELTAEEKKEARREERRGS
jgi:DNA gyrase/topoisomerase IV subunit A